MTTIKLTAYHADVKKFFRYGSTEKRDNIMYQIEKAVVSIGKSFHALFPNKTKRRDVMKRILLLVSESGVCAVESKTLATQLDCSIRTVSDAVKRLKETDQILVGGLADGSNKYLFLYKQHPNFKTILKEAFYLDDLAIEELSHSSIAEHNASVNVEEIAEPKSLESVDTVDVEDDKEGFKSIMSLGLLSTKQEINNYIASTVESDISLVNNDEKKLNQVDLYFTNKYQHLLYNTFKNDLSVSESVRDSLAVIGLRMGSNCCQENYIRAYQTVIKLDGFVKQGGVIKESIAAMFTKVYKDGLKLNDYSRKNKTEHQEVKTNTPHIKEVEFYNWLELRG